MKNLDLHSTYLARYADQLIRNGIHVQPGQLVQITAEAIHRNLAVNLAESAYRAGAKFVNVDLIDLRTTRARVLHSNLGDLSYVPGATKVKYQELLEAQAANIRIIGPEEPLILADLDPKKLNASQMALRQALRPFYDDGIGKSFVQWTVAAAATPAWAARIFPELEPEVGCKKLWEHLFAFARVDHEDYLNAWNLHGKKLQARAERLTQARIRTLRFKGPGTDLKVTLSPQAIWRGGPELSKRGLLFSPNIPTEECFTTPDAGKTEGYARATRPFLVNGRLVEGLEMQFRAGVLSDFKATSGAETFREYISSDAGALRLGEVALVGTDSPIYQSGRVFEEILLDENAACHVAIGSAYKFCLENGNTATPEELRALGCNESSVHTDMMISSEQVDVSAQLSDGAEMQIISQGKWHKEFV